MQSTTDCLAPTRRAGPPLPAQPAPYEVWSVPAEGWWRLWLEGPREWPGWPRTRWFSKMFFVLVNSQTYQLLIGHLGWTVPESRQWLVQVLDQELFGSQTPPP